MTQVRARSLKPRIAFSLVDAGSQWTGGLNYLRSLISALDKYGALDIEISVYYPANAEAPRFDHSAAISFLQSPMLRRHSLAWFLDRLSVRLGSRPWLKNSVLKRDGVLVDSHASPSRDQNLLSIGWIPDFQHIHLPALFSHSQRVARDRVFLDIARHSDRIILSSEDARQDFLQFAPFAAAKSRVLRFSALPQDPWACDLPTLRSKYEIDRPYFYVPNQLWAHKNHMLLISALKVCLDSHPDILILCSGGTSDFRNPEHFADLQRQVAEADLGNNIRFLGLIPYGHIAPLMLHATALINPSLFEGWSTTVEEGKALGIPLLLSDIAVHREQAKDTAKFFAPDSAPDLAKILLSVHSNTFPERTRDAIASSLARHDQRIEEFAMDYVRIVRELV